MLELRGGFLELGDALLSVLIFGPSSSEQRGTSPALWEFSL
jgi:hypothetical protein